MRTGAWIVLGLLMIGACQSMPGSENEVDPYDSGGPLLPEQAAYDVTYYDLTLAVSPADSSVQGILKATARIASPTAWFVLDLDPILDISEINEMGESGEVTRLDFERRGGRVWASFPYMKQPGDIVTVEVAYQGRPRIAPNPPWDGGFTWAKTTDGQPWIATSCQGEGADIWWPVKDHISDKPDSMALHITVPDPLVVATNGALQNIVPNSNGTSTYHWFVSTPISTYNVALNIAPYRTITDSFESVAGDSFTVVFYVLPEVYEKGQQLFPEILDQLRFFEETVGPYPFRADKYGVAQTPHLGMEHQTIIAYGANFDNGAMTGGTDWGFDALHQHELAHEWWGNLVTNADWSDMWIHEGFGTYMQPLYAEVLNDMEGYHAYMDNMRGGITNQIPVAPREVRSADQIYGGDIYVKGAWVLHTLRFLIGEDHLRTALRRMAYPDPAMEAMTDGRQVRFVTTNDFVNLIEDITGKELDWFFEVYVRQPKLPELVTRHRQDQLELSWKVPDDLPFPMPVDVQIGDTVYRIDMPGGRGQITIPSGADPVVDPKNWILRSGQ